MTTVTLEEREVTPEAVEKFRLSDSVKRVLFQIVVSNEKAVPDWVRRQTAAEIMAEMRMDAKAAPMKSGKVVLESLEHCSVDFLIDQVRDKGYTLVNSVCKPREKGVGQGRTVTSFVMQFLFVEDGELDVDGLPDEFWGRAVEDADSLVEMLEEALYSAMIFENPFIDEQGEEVSGQSILSVNLGFREPLFHGDGTPVMVRPKNSAGQKLWQEAPQPLKAKHDIMLAPDGSIMVVVA